MFNTLIASISYDIRNSPPSTSQINSNANYKTENKRKAFQWTFVSFDLISVD